MFLTLPTLVSEYLTGFWKSFWEHWETDPNFGLAKIALFRIFFSIFWFLKTLLQRTTVDINSSLCTSTGCRSKIAKNISVLVVWKGFPSHTQWKETKNIFIFLPQNRNLFNFFLHFLKIEILNVLKIFLYFYLKIENFRKFFIFSQDRNFF